MAEIGIEIKVLGFAELDIDIHRDGSVEFEPLFAY